MLTHLLMKKKEVKKNEEKNKGKKEKKKKRKKKKKKKNMKNKRTWEEKESQASNYAKKQRADAGQRLQAIFFPRWIGPTDAIEDDQWPRHRRGGGTPSSAPSNINDNYIKPATIHKNRRGFAPFSIHILSSFYHPYQCTTDIHRVFLKITTTRLFF